MGHTHYWRRSRDFDIDEWEKIKGLVIRMIGNLPSEVIMRDTSGENRPVITDEFIGFNGDLDSGMANDSFWLERQIERADELEFCKTRYKPYDLAVCVTLLIVQGVAPDAISVSSDGGPEDWEQAVALHAQLTI